MLKPKAKYVKPAGLKRHRGPCFLRGTSLRFRWLARSSSEGDLDPSIRELQRVVKVTRKPGGVRRSNSTESRLPLLVPQSRGPLPESVWLELEPLHSLFAACFRATFIWTPLSGPNERRPNDEPSAAASFVPRRSTSQVQSSTPIPKTNRFPLCTHHPASALLLAFQYSWSV